MSLLWLDSSVPPNTLSSWVRHTPEARKQYEAAINSLKTLHIITDPKLGKISLNSTLKTSLRLAITGGGDHRSFGVACERDEKRPPTSIEFLDKHASQTWETILHFMVSSGTGQSAVKPSEGVCLLLRESGLMTQSYPTHPLVITSLGFQFLLQPPHGQLWDLLSHYLRMTEVRDMDIVEVLSFLFMLSTMELGQDYSIEGLSDTQKVMLDDLRDYGLVWQRKSTSKRFYPTRLATTLTSSLPPLLTSKSGANNSSDPSTDASADSQGFIVIETNYRLYAYTDNPLQIAVLNLFTQMKARYPNLVVGSLNRDSVKKALINGITADQIISYLTTHAHPQMRKQVPIISSTVQDQIRIWENERNRVRKEEGYLYNDFSAEKDYYEVLAYAHQLGVVKWESAERKLFFGTNEGHEHIKSFIERRKQAGSQHQHHHQQQQQQQQHNGEWEDYY